MNIKVWFDKFQKRPLKISGILLLLIWSAFALKSYFAILDAQDNFVRNTANLLSMSLRSKDRVISEGLLDALLSQNNASFAIICDGNKQVVSVNSIQPDCNIKSNIFMRQVGVSIPGSESYVLKTEFDLISIMSPLFVILGISLCLVVIGFYFIYSAQRRILEDILNPLATQLLTNEDLKIHELTELRVQVRKITSLEAQKAVVLALKKNNLQVAHDIRSPLSALNMVIETLKDQPEDKRLLIRNAVQRINDIANNLLEKGKENKNLILEQDDRKFINNELLTALADLIISEKRIQYREKANIIIEAELNKAYGLFGEVYSGELKRAISNAINNSVESFDDNSGRVVVTIEPIIENYIKMAQISIKDNGKGIPKNILSKIGETGFSFGKETKTESGSGLGVAHAKKLIQDLGGEFIIESELGRGTEVKMRLPLAQSPSWFLDKIKISKTTLFVSVDDDLSIHQIWSGRLKSLSQGKEKIDHLSFTSVQDFKDWQEKENPQDVIYLIDYEFLNQKMNGLELIEALQIQNKSVLVTSRFEEPHVKEKTEQLGLKMIPKTLSSIVPIEIENTEKYDAVLIDDDSLIHMTWDMAAKMKNKKIIKFKDSQSFLNSESQIDRQTPVYIDVDLKGESGVDLSRKVHALGFHHIYLCTGYAASSIDKPAFVQAILGKDFPG